ncbi:hypothetical protein DdX_21163 [Ditylenchus destructor]|uniref:Uncharacterized protein n=1 Tax=Ditylenchus destructor TaxID=166010 RepID=A0AAD4QVY7_9BILA|nr:hypothetical protein DdX_21163 [Ditylenchus destructor]
MNQSIASFMPSPEHDRSDNEWISQLNLKRFEPIGFKAKKAMRKVLVNDDNLMYLGRNTMDITLKEKLSLERFDDPTSLRIFCALLASPKFRQEYNVPLKLAFKHVAWLSLFYHDDSFNDVIRIWAFYEENGDIYRISTNK